MSGLELELEPEIELGFAHKLVGGEELGVAEYDQLLESNWEVKGNPPLLLLVLYHWFWVAVPIEEELQTATEVGE